jgi:hypothetical protein
MKLGKIMRMLETRRTAFSILLLRERKKNPEISTYYCTCTLRRVCWFPSDSRYLVQSNNFYRVSIVWNETKTTKFQEKSTSKYLYKYKSQPFLQENRLFSQKIEKHHVLKSKVSHFYGYL